MSQFLPIRPAVLSVKLRNNAKTLRNNPNCKTPISSHPGNINEKSQEQVYKEYIQITCHGNNLLNKKNKGVYRQV